MTIYRTGYDTTVGSSIVTRNIENTIKESLVRDIIYNNSLDVVDTLEYKPCFILGNTVSESQIPVFYHPIIVTHKGISFLCSDIRPCAKIDTQGDHKLIITNQTEYNMAFNRMIMNLAWLTGATDRMRLDFSLASSIFSGWLSEVISRRYALDPGEQLTLSVISSYYYQTLFYSKSEYGEDMIQKFALHTIGATMATSDLVFKTFDKIGKMESIEDYCNTVKDILQNIRLNDFNLGMLITIIGNTWYGLNAKETLAIALEHPPTWISIVHGAFDERGYKYSMIAKIAEKYGKGKLGQNYIRTFNNFKKDYVVVKNVPKFRDFN